MPISQLAGSDVSSDTARSKTFVFNNEGHTLGNALRSIISTYPDVQLCCYTLPHPAEATMNFRIQMTKGKAVDALKRGLEDLAKLCDVTLEKFDEELRSSK
ncbi:RNA polymerases I and III subunit AC2 l(2)37Cg [Leptinotarsa decemlineata]|uniref:RNA polymerases I and III subunit AC2 l(2)37Cg n=1 Tax=Leptinotarsa decemlineata TaxID=7539 RepID=UPI000C2539D1|nr:probable DNA-directed RNA polymerases I and III subunit RPAC2 [Leptinotarsa decemlineata]XP_023026042.1 probable DNA-directed RNA polymerases I and III subunit RPAC2 [Leptinotarsa decemlineata]